MHTKSMTVRYNHMRHRINNYHVHLYLIHDENLDPTKVKSGKLKPQAASRLRAKPKIDPHHNPRAASGLW